MQKQKNKPEISAHRDLTDEEKVEQVYAGIQLSFLALSYWTNQIVLTNRRERVQRFVYLHSKHFEGFQSSCRLLNISFVLRDDNFWLIKASIQMHSHH